MKIKIEPIGPFAGVLGFFRSFFCAYNPIHFSVGFVVLLLLSNSEIAVAGTACSSFSGGFTAASYGYYGTSSASGFNAGDKITVTVNNTGNAGSSYAVRDSTSATNLLGPTITTNSYSFPANTSDTISINVNNNGGGLDISWACTPAPATTTTVSGAPNASTYGQTVTITATVSGTGGPAGTVSFTVDGNSAGTATLSGGTASITTSSLAVGTHNIVANYPGDINNASSAGSYTQTVNKAAQTISFPAIPNTAFSSTPPTPGATASSNLAVTYSSATTSVCTVTSAGAISFVSTGTCTIHADQAGNGNYTAATQVSQSFTVTPGSNVITFPTLPATAFSSSPPTPGATASSNLAVTYSSATTSVCTVTSAGAISFVSTGTCTIHADQPGNTNYVAATQVSNSFAVTQGSNVISFAPLTDHTLASGSFSLSATASSGLTVTFASATPQTCTVAGTTVTLVTTGQCTVAASQGGNSTYSPATPVNQSFNITKGVTKISLSVSTNTLVSGAPLTLTAKVTGLSPTGTVTFLDGATTLASAALQSGTATVTTKALATGVHNVSARYNGDANNLSVSSSVVSVAVTALPDPSHDPDVVGTAHAQVSALQRFGQAQIDNLENRLSQLHDVVSSGNASSSFGTAFNGSTASLSGARPQAYPAAYPPSDFRMVAFTSGGGSPEQTNDRTMAAMAATDAINHAGARLPFHVWVGGSVNFGDFTQSGGTDHSFTTSGVTLGIDGKIRDRLQSGLAVGYASDKTIIGSDGTHSNARAVSAALYASYHALPSTFLDAIIGYGNATLSSERYSSAGNVFLHGSRNAKLLFGSAALSIDKKWDSLQLAPYLRLDAVHMMLAPYTETGSTLWALSYQQMTTNAVSGAIGSRATYGIPVSWGRLSVAARLENRSRLKGSYNQQLSYAQLLGGTVYTVTDQGLSSNQIVSGIGLRVLTDRVSVQADYQLSASGGQVEEQSIFGKVSLPF
ncbi:Ig-like domain repeat protein [Mangrovitalea sediminis]|uniref:Ig-like domain repeat protein n=1 Tax=Mangrovitalea sediminis TaxID=1982043 RepID=UPI000BE597B4|nr:Ig-like domain repeat protein [Mangrovitalea sediminis]